MEAFTVEAEWVSTRLDKYLASVSPTLSRTRVQRLLEEGHIAVNDAICKDDSYRVKEGDKICMGIPAPQPTDLVANPTIPLDIVYEDDDLIVVNKQAGLSVHPVNMHDHHTLVNALISHCGDNLSGVGGVIRPGIVHRLDKDTTGLMLVAKNDHAHQFLSEQLADRSLSRVYVAVCWGVPNPPFATINTQITMHPQHRTKMRVVSQGGKEAITNYRVLESLAGGNFSIVECRLSTGRTHQIRVHLSYRGHSLVGDHLYEKPLLKSLRNLSPAAQMAVKEFPRQALHAKQIEFIHPVTQEKLTFDSQLPVDIQNLIHTIPS
ncbi:MAG: RluA family pseudouridine synthase [Alphaproteobacteria bacterium]|nr:RluA family pseudouridine synthase [Alphaproteobacteria bacterium]